MSAAPEIVQVCSGCGATIYPEHFSRGLAIRQAGKLLCRHCHEASKVPAAQPGDDSVSLQLADAPDSSDRSGRSSLHGLAGFTAVGASEAIYRKPAGKPGVANRMRTFHAKLAEGAIFHLDEQVNGWLDAHPDIEVKFATTSVGTWEGKHPEPNLVLTIFY